MWGSSGLSHEPSPLLTCSSIWSSSCPGFNQHTNAEGAHIYHSKPLTIRPKYLTPYLTSSPRWKGNDRPKTFFLSNPSSSTHCQQLDTWYQLLRVEMSHPWWAPDLTLPPTRAIPVFCSAYFPGVIQIHFPHVQSLHFSPGHLISCLVYCVCVLDAQSCPTLCDPMDCGPLDSSVREILQARILERGAILFSRGIILTQRSTLGLLADSLLSEPFTTVYQLSLCPQLPFETILHKTEYGFLKSEHTTFQ